MTDIRIGDRFKIEIEVKRLSPIGGWVFCSAKHDDESAIEVRIATLLASERIDRPIAEGDRVHFCTSTDVLTVRRIVDNYAWVAAAPHDVGAVCPVDNLRRALGVSMEGGE